MCRFERLPLQFRLSSSTSRRRQAFTQQPAMTTNSPTCSGCAFFRQIHCLVEPVVHDTTPNRPACRHFLRKEHAHTLGRPGLKFPQLQAQQEAQLPAIAKELRNAR